MKQKNWFSLLLTAAITVLTFGCNQQEKNKTSETTNTASEAVNQQPYKPPDKSVLAGNWFRTDAEYRIQISELFDDGKMKAGYFNPKSINVAEARWTSNGGIIKIYIELRDLNYPGSNYNLTYMQDRDMLAGEYYQAVERTTFKVEFVRRK